MKIGIMSDSHDNLPNIHKAVELFNKEGVSKVIHAGDIISPFCLIELSKLKCPLIAVFGNNDGEKRLWQEKIKSVGEIHSSPHEFQIEGKKFLLTHSLDDIPEGKDMLGQYDIVIFGHSHKPEARTRGKTLFINPGEAGGWVSGRSTVAILNIPGLSAEILGL